MYGSRHGLSRHGSSAPPLSKFKFASMGMRYGHERTCRGRTTSTLARQQHSSVTPTRQRNVDSWAVQKRIFRAQSGGRGPELKKRETEAILGGALLPEGKTDPGYSPTTLTSRVPFGAEKN